MDERIFNNYQKPAFNLYCNGQQISTDIPEINFDIADDDCKSKNLPADESESKIEIKLKKNPYKKYKPENLKVKATFSDGEQRIFNVSCLKATANYSKKYLRYMKNLEVKKFAKSLGLTYQQFIRTRNRAVNKFIKDLLALAF